MFKVLRFFNRRCGKSNQIVRVNCDVCESEWLGGLFVERI